MVDANHGGVDHLDCLGRRPAASQRIEQQVPQSCQAPSSELPIDGVPLAEFLGQTAPGRVGARHPEDAAQRPPVLARPPGLRPHKRFEKRPFRIAHQTANQNRPPPRGSLESHHRFNENPLCQQDLIGFRATRRYRRYPRMTNRSTAAANVAPIYKHNSNLHSSLLRWLHTVGCSNISASSAMRSQKLAVTCLAGPPF